MRSLFWIMVLIVLFSWVSGEDYEEELKQEQVYIDNVCSGLWPDFRRLSPDCK